MALGSSLRVLDQPLSSSQIASSALTNRRYKSTQTSTGDDETGHIAAAENEGIFFLDNVFPLKLNVILSPFRTLVNTSKLLPRLMGMFDSPEDSAAHPAAIAKRATSPSTPIKITEVLPRVEEGGTFVKFTYPQDQDRKEIEKQIKKHLKEHPIKPWFNPFKPARAFMVKGVPWLEDLHRLPSQMLKVEFVPAKAGQPSEDVSEETLYTIFRKYGKIKDIKPQAKDSKELPRYALIYYHWMRHAILAKNCVHGYTIPPNQGGGSAGSNLKLTYQGDKKPHLFWDWLINHPRILFPLLAALLGTAAVAIFDPIRTFSIKAHVTRSFHITDNKIYKWFMSQATRANQLLNIRRKKGDDTQIMWDDRKDSIEKLNTWLMESADTFIVIQGPRGSGKKEFVFDQGLKGRKNTLIIDCKAIQEARGDSATIRAAAVEVGYRPIFSWMNSMSSLIDLAAQGTIGTKTGFSETLDTQLQKIWQNTSTALRQIAIDGKHKDDKDAHLGDDEYLEAHPEKRPVVVIDNFLHKSQEGGVVYDKLSEWAASLTTANVAHVIFLTTDVSFSKSLSKALPDRVFRQISLGDCSPEVAKRFVINHLDATDAAEDSSKSDSEKNAPPPSQSRDDLGELDSCISTLGGRLTDLEFLARRIKSGETPVKAVEEIISLSASEVLKMFILDVDSTSTNGRGWSPQQAWLVIRALSASESLKYNDFVTNGGGAEAPLRALQQAELITIVSNNGRPSCIKPGKPVYTAAFKKLTDDRVLRASMDLSTLAEDTKTENATIAKCEDELRVLGELPGKPAETAGRVRYLLGKLRVSQEKVEGMDREASRLKKVLQEEY
ncbi:uncharacterized protein KY384_000156 [Bacidia gigantensis]|uniref:uncharacterized protein n=1 Tax=Bacidia gigantensis TaxID=2732470 RepID=UPI001D038508|nr:uncharacterized protein KY384_000156 [Bacidia gigantensis]KAG8526163.1 hypothetical protein KY384_000156 [Bacidia gigantensis]